MKYELFDFKVEPKVVAVNRETTINITPRGCHARFDDDKGYMVHVIPMNNGLYSFPGQETTYPGFFVYPQGGAISITHTFSQEQMYMLQVWQGCESLHEFFIFSLESDLFCRRPYKGDLHVHTCCSDGREDPVVVVAQYRRAGFDFMAITDHEMMYPSIDAINSYSGIPTDIALFQGEEVHSFGYIHAVNFGGRFSVNDYYNSHKEEIHLEIKAYASTHPTPCGIDSLDYACRQWVADKIRESGGLAIYAHPHWIMDAFHVPDSVSDYVFAQHTYDVFELLGGLSCFENNMQTAFYNEQRAKGRNMPIVGSSDSHDCVGAENFGRTYTIVFSEDISLPTIQSAITSGYSTAVEAYKDEQKRVYGSYRMVRYAQFLEREYFPLYQELCYEQGRAMQDAVLGDHDAMDVLALLKGRTDKFFNRFFGRIQI